MCKGLGARKVVSSNFTHTLTSPKCHSHILALKSTLGRYSLLDIEYRANYVSFII